MSFSGHEVTKAKQTQRLYNWLQDHNINPRLNKGDGKYDIVQTGNRQLARWFSIFKQPNTPLIIPEFIWHAEPNIRASFLAGLMDGDGGYSQRPVFIVSTVYGNFAKDVINLLATLGIISELHVTESKVEKWKTIYIVSVKDALARNKAMDLLGQFSCNEWIRISGRQRGYTVPGYMVKRDLPYKSYKNKWPGSCDGNMNSATLLELIDQTNYVPVKVIGKKLYDQEMGYFIQLEDANPFIVEYGFLLGGNF